ncbi:AraC family transcriptional regulator [Paenibacillus psychroresistens]|uniref:AraC family transcriptional regulator n=1 Tax=Paenibacillus psychroresistens TaxID=1778678 RepID=A0A6B8RM33_9BACL|nr:AraC family transcriptional regulator [Paenibacillus psychroresistens]QGQ97350.1 AraC family transcriptional regulator [Paenibacillus psychroresistens]
MNDYKYLIQSEFPRLIGYPIAIGHVYDEPEHSIRRIIHPSFTYNIHFIVKGKGYIKTSTEMIPLKAGNGFLYGCDQAQYFGSDLEEPWEAWWIFFKGKGIQNVLGNIGKNEAWVFTTDAISRIEAIFIRIFELTKQDKSTNEAQYAVLLYELIVEMQLHSKQINGITPIQASEKINKSAEYIQKNCSKNIMLEQAAEISGFSPSYFSRMFRQLKGKTFVEYLFENRLKLAKKYLLTTNLSIKRIAFETGFASSNYFIEKFRKQEQITPSQFRETLKVKFGGRSEN